MTSSVIVSSVTSSVDSSGYIGSGGVSSFYIPSDSDSSVSMLGVISSETGSSIVSFGRSGAFSSISGSPVVSLGIPSIGAISVEPPEAFSDVSTSGNPSTVIGFTI